MLVLPFIHSYVGKHVVSKYLLNGYYVQAIRNVMVNKRDKAPTVTELSQVGEAVQKS